MRSEALSARNALSLAQARAAADGAVERIAFELSAAAQPPKPGTADGQRARWQRRRDRDRRRRRSTKSAKIDLNAAAEPLLKGLLDSVGRRGAEAAAQRVVDAILDWRDPDDLKRPNGAEAADYRAAGRKYRPPNAPFEAVGRAAARARHDPGALLVGSPTA